MTEVQRPSAERVAKRTLILSALANRAMLELDKVDGIERHREGIPRWLEAVGLDDEVEDEERAVFDCMSADQSWFNLMWRIEGVHTLCWALGLCDEPKYDELANAPLLGQSVPVGARPETVDAFVTNAKLRRGEEQVAFFEHVLAAHWRLRDFDLNPNHLEFAEASKGYWYGTFDITKFKVVDGDMALEGKTLSKAPQQAFANAYSSAMERHTAIEWLRGGAERYTDVVTHT